MRAVREAKDALDVVILHERAELDRLQRRLDRVDTRLAALVTGGVAFAALLASLLAALHRQIDVAAIVLIGIGGVGIGGSVLLSLFGGDPRFRGSIWLLSQARAVMRALGERDLAWIVVSTHKLRRSVDMMKQAGVEVPDLPETAMWERSLDMRVKCSPASAGSKKTGRSRSCNLTSARWRFVEVLLQPWPFALCSSSNSSIGESCSRVPRHFFLPLAFSRSRARQS